MADGRLRRLRRKGRGFDYEANLRAFRAGEVALDPARSGLYRRYHLLVASLLDVRRMTVDALLAEPIPQAFLSKRRSAEIALSFRARHREATRAERVTVRVFDTSGRVDRRRQIT